MTSWTVACSVLALLPIGPVSAAVEERVAGCVRPSACWITAFAFTPDGTEIFYVERFTGDIRRFEVATGTDTRFARVKNVAGRGEEGVLGIAIDPNWSNGQEQVFVYYTQRRPRRNRIVRLRRDRRGIQRRVLATIPGATYHNGGALHFGPDGKLYATTGDAGHPARALGVRNLAGKVLRMTKRGGRPPTNPFKSVVYSRGHRNSFGFAWDPLTGRLWQTENGPECDDEINLIRRRRNYGWGPRSECPRTSESGPNPVQPALRINPIIAPTGAAFCDRCGLGALHGDLLVGAFVPEGLYALELNAKRNDIVDRSRILNRRDAVLAVEAAPDGTVFFSDVRGIYRVS
jgi:glucose/arabinose dehydrogenase